VKNNSTTGNPDGTEGVEVINVTSNGSVRSSYYESSMNIENIIYSTTTEEEKDAAYEALESDDSDQAAAYFNAATGEVLLNDYLKRKLSKLPDIINAQSIAVEYDKKQFEKGDIKPEHLFSCTYKNKHGDEILYNKGTAPHDIAYDVGFAQSVVVNTTADAAFTTSVKRDAQDLSNMLSEIKQINTTLTTLKKEKEAAAEADKPTVQAKIDAAQKAYDFMRENIQKEFEHKITSMQKALDVANIAVTDNGTRSKRLDLIADRLMTQTTTFQTLKSENEDIDLAEAATKLTTAQVTYEASLMATGKISQTSLMNYI
jgi:flagellar hook-associated protein 3 FlgL